MRREARIRALVVDDEPLARARLKELIAELAWLEQVGEAASGAEAIAALDRLRPDLVFLDIQLPGISGLEVLRTTRHTPAIVFTTAHDRFAVTAFELGALDYILKPFGRERFGQAMQRAKPVLEARLGGGAAERARDVLAEGPLLRLFVRDGGRIVPLPLTAVERIQACDDVVLVHAGERVYRLNVPLADLERRLDPRVFVRIHRSHLVNLEHVASLEPLDDSRLEVQLRSGLRLMASRQRSRALRGIGR
ncbi:MAG: LytR/AlgR family response regulator transcription factor [Myxococcaceae bacterium]